MRTIKPRWKCEISLDSGYYYGSNMIIFNPDVTPRWQDVLAALSTMFNSEGSPGPISPFTIDQINTDMQSRWPGNYTVAARHDPNTDTLKWVLIFKDKHEEIIWRLKNSS